MERLKPWLFNDVKKLVQIKKMALRFWSHGDFRFKTQHTSPYFIELLRNVNLYPRNVILDTSKTLSLSKPPTVENATVSVEAQKECTGGFKKRIAYFILPTLDELRGRMSTLDKAAYPDPQLHPGRLLKFLPLDEIFFQEINYVGMSKQEAEKILQSYREESVREETNSKVSLRERRRKQKERKKLKLQAQSKKFHNELAIKTDDRMIPLLPPPLQGEGASKRSQRRRKAKEHDLKLKTTAPSKSLASQTPSSSSSSSSISTPGTLTVTTVKIISDPKKRKLNQDQKLPEKKTKIST